MDTLLTHVETLACQLRSHLPPAAQPYLTRDNVQGVLRVIVIAATYLLFRPHLEGLMRKMSGTPDPRRAEIEARREVLRQYQQDPEEHQRRQQQRQVEVDVGGKKRMAVVGPDGKIIGLKDDGADGAGRRNGTPGRKEKKKGK